MYITLSQFTTGIFTLTAMVENTPDMIAAMMDVDIAMMSSESELQLLLLRQK